MTEPNTTTKIKTATVVTIAGAAGCLMTVIIVGALVLGVVIDKLLGFRGPFTIGLVLVSAPASLYIAFRLVSSLIKRTLAPPESENTETSF